MDGCILEEGAGSSSSLVRVFWWDGTLRHTFPNTRREEYLDHKRDEILRQVLAARECNAAFGTYRYRRRNLCRRQDEEGKQREMRPTHQQLPELNEHMGVV